MINILQKHIHKAFEAKIIACDKVGGGMAGGIVYKLTIDKSPYVLAVKTTDKSTLLKEECSYIQYINRLVDIKLPKIYYEYYCDDINFVIMEYFDGVNCASDFLLNAPLNIRLNVANQIAENIIKLQQIKGEKYGDLLNPTYCNWHEYYKPFAKNLIDEAIILEKDGYITKHILNTLQELYQKYDKIFDEPISKPTMIHGDYWAQNIIIDKNYKLIGVVDPFNCMWADSEYELFALNALYGDKLPVLQAFLAKEKVSKKFFLKNSFYLLFSETYFVVKLHHDNVAYLNDIIKELNKQLEIFKI